MELDEEVKVGEESARGNLSDLHGGEIALDGTGEWPTHGSTEVVGVHPSVDKAVKHAEDCRGPHERGWKEEKAVNKEKPQARCGQLAK